MFAGLRRLRPELPVSLLPKRSLVAISHAIEDECAYGASDLLLFGAFQRDATTARASAAGATSPRVADAAFVFADFPKPRRPRGGPVEIPIGAQRPARP